MTRFWGAAGGRGVMAMRMRWMAAALAVSAAGGAWAADEAVKVLMTASANPAALAFWAAGNDPPEGETQAEADARWRAAAQAAETLKADAVRLNAPELAREGDWTRYAALMAEAAELGSKAIAARDAAAAFEAGGRLYDACDGCHKAYIPRRQ